MSSGAASNVSPFRGRLIRVDDVHKVVRGSLGVSLVLSDGDAVTLDPAVVATAYHAWWIERKPRLRADTAAFEVRLREAREAVSKIEAATAPRVARWRSRVLGLTPRQFAYVVLAIILGATLYAQQALLLVAR